MKPRKTSGNLPVGRLTQIADALPPPHELVFPEETVKVTLLLSKSSVKFFKQRAARYRTTYQTMIRALVDRYAEQHSRG